MRGKMCILEEMCGGGGKGTLIKQDMQVHIGMIGVCMCM